MKTISMLLVLLCMCLNAPAQTITSDRIEVDTNGRYYVLINDSSYYSVDVVKQELTKIGYRTMVQYTYCDNKAMRNCISETKDLYDSKLNDMPIMGDEMYLSDEGLNKYAYMMNLTYELYIVKINR